jgi:hypothetical protein
MYRKLGRFHSEKFMICALHQILLQDKIDVCGRIILKWILNKWTVRAWMSSPVS